MMNVRVKVDEDLPRQIADLFTERGYDATTVVGQKWQGLSDGELWPRVQQEGRWLVTADKGFADLRTYPPGSHAGVLLFRLDRSKAVPEFVAEMLNSPECLTNLRGRAKHAIGQSSLNQQDISSVLLPLPEIRVQKKLAEEFSYLQSISAELRQEMADGTSEINSMTQAVLSKAFAGEL